MCFPVFSFGSLLTPRIVSELSCHVYIDYLQKENYVSLPRDVPKATCQVL